jgi:hypothetical protein
MEALPFLRESHSMLPRRPTIYPGTEMALVQVCVCAVRCKGGGEVDGFGGEVHRASSLLVGWGGGMGFPVGAAGGTDDLPLRGSTARYKNSMDGGQRSRWRTFHGWREFFAITVLLLTGFFLMVL